VSNFLFGFMFGMFVTLLGAMLLPRRRRLSSGKDGIGRGPAPLCRQPEQPLTAQLIRYWKWEDEQVRQALEEYNNPPPETHHEQS
jgi:hypothetical protein